MNRVLTADVRFFDPLTKSKTSLAPLVGIETLLAFPSAYRSLFIEEVNNIRTEA